MREERRRKSNAEDWGKRFGEEDQRVAFQFGPDVGTICGQGWHAVISGEQMGEWTGRPSPRALLQIERLKSTLGQAINSRIAFVCLRI